MTETFDCTIRAAGRRDAAEILVLARALATTYVVDQTAFRAAFDGILADETNRVLVAEVGGRVCGYVHGLTHLAFHANGAIGRVEELMVDASVQGQGVGRALMTAFERWAVGSVGVRYVAVATRRAEDFYVSLGYEPSATYLKKSVTDLL